MTMRTIRSVEAGLRDQSTGHSSSRRNSVPLYAENAVKSPRR